MSNPDRQIFLNTDILRWNGGDVERLGYPKTKTEDEMCIIARRYGCKVVTKNGKNGKWYIKGMGRPYEYLKNEINKNRGNSREGVYCILLP
jgi:hypothetical protein